MTDQCLSYMWNLIPESLNSPIAETKNPLPREGKGLVFLVVSAALTWVGANDGARAYLWGCVAVLP